MGWRDVAEAQHGVVTRAHVLADGVSRHALARMTGSGVLVPRARGVFVVAGSPVTVRQRLWVAVLATCGVLAFDPAAWLWGITDDPVGAVDVVVPPQRRIRRPDGVRVHRLYVPRQEIVSLEGLPVTSRSWTVLDRLGRLPRPAGVRLADRALQRGWLTERQLALRLSGHPGRSGNVALREIARRVGDGAAAESERILHRLLREAGCDGWRPNLAVSLGGRVIAVVDVAFPGIRLAIEVDGHAYHHDVDRFRRDRRRQNALVSAGWTVLRFTWADLLDRPDEVIHMIQAQIVERSAD